MDQTRVHVSEQTKEVQEEQTFGGIYPGGTRRPRNEDGRPHFQLERHRQIRSAPITGTQTSEVEKEGWRRASTSALDVREDEYAHADHLDVDMQRQEQSKTLRSRPLWFCLVNGLRRTTCVSAKGKNGLVSKTFGTVTHPICNAFTQTYLLRLWFSVDYLAFRRVDSSS